MKKPITLRLISVGISLLVCFLLACSHTSKLTCEKLRNSYFDIRRNLHNRHDSLQFINSLETLLANDPDCLKALQLKGSINLVFNHLPIAKEAFMQAYDLDSTNPYTCYYLAIINRMEGNGKHALSYLAKAITSKEKNGAILNTNNDFFKDLDIDYYEVLYLTAIVAYEQGQLSLSKLCFLTYEKGGNQLKNTYGYLASIYAHENMQDSSCYYFKLGYFGEFPGNMRDSLARVCNFDVLEFPANEPQH